ncbi:glutamyl-tRNA(Gln) amidotransferase subunit C, mitochondrial-like isoform X2 [Mytilus californianus]|uniref:glutamyl-tRNA(Gln) amidotransferase subunit C, mitochondrial-like isoform X2 n=1 Tax=Mytilus californianus TaxID=6549 RepID=UPI00224610BA|nr:glutamyl-tRNA(Gln) amidotransferase subunit C, mitochondrial-like isoform X2 [Mytilus californianus]
MLFTKLTCRLWFQRVSRNSKGFCSKVPKTPIWEEVDHTRIPNVPHIDQEMINHLERVSLVEFNNQAGIERLSKAIESANKLHMVNTDGIEPMESVLEDRMLYLREDKVTDGKCKQEVLSNAVKTIEDYFVAPPGNIPLKTKERDYGNNSKGS